MIAVIPAAGMASRLRPLTSTTPKCLLPVKGTPLLGRALAALRNAGVDEVVIVTGYLSGMIRDYVNQFFPDIMVRWVHNADFESTNNIYSLYLARPWAEGKDTILLDSDILFDPSIITLLCKQGYSDTLALSAHACGEEEVKVRVDGKMMVEEISKTVDTLQAAGESVGIEKMSGQYTSVLFPMLEQMIEGEGMKNVFYEMAFERLIPLGYKFQAIDIAPLKAVEIDTVEDYMAIK